MAGPKNLPDISHLLVDDPEAPPSPAALSNISSNAPIGSDAYNAAVSAKAQNAIEGGAPTYYSKKNLPNIDHLLRDGPDTSSTPASESKDQPKVDPTPPEDYPDFTQEQRDALKMPDWAATPELHHPLSALSYRAAARLMSATGEDFKSIMADNFPDAEVKDLGNGIIKVTSKEDGKSRVWRTGVQGSDFLRAAAGIPVAAAGAAAVAAALPEEIPAGIATLLARMAHGFGASAAIEGVNKLGGGEVRGGNLLAGTLMEPAIAGATKFGQTAWDALRGNAPAAGAVLQGAPTQRMVKTIADAAERDPSAVGTLMREIKPDPRAVVATQQLGIDLHPDQLSSNPTFKAASQALKSSIGSAGATAQQESDRLAAQTIRDTAERWGVQFDQGGFSESLLNDMKGDIAADRSGSSQAYAKIRETLPDAKRVNPPKRFLAWAREHMAGVKNDKSMSPDIANALEKLSDGPTQGQVNTLERKFRKTERNVPGGFADTTRAQAGEAGRLLKLDSLDAAELAGREAFVRGRMASASRGLPVAGAYSPAAEQAAGLAFRNELAAAQAGVAARKVKEDAFVQMFGIEASERLKTGSLVPKMNAGMQALQNQKDPVPIGKMLSAVPAPRRQEAALTAMSYAFGKPTPENPVNFGQIVKFANALDRDSAVRDAIMPHLPAGFKQDWKAIVQVARSINDTAKYVVKTGRVLDADTAGAGRLVANIVDTAAYWGGKPGVAARGVVNFVMKAAQEERKAAVNAYMTSPEFHGLVGKILAREPIPMGFLERQAARPLFQRFAKAAQIPVSDRAKLLQKLVLVPAAVGAPVRAGAADYLENN